MKTLSRTDTILYVAAAIVTAIAAAASAGTHAGEAFIDVHAAANTSTGCGTYFPAAKGWDPQTGWGYPHWPGLIKHFGSDSHLQALQ